MGRQKQFDIHNAPSVLTLQIGDFFKVHAKPAVDFLD
jgi:hypothetical protein